MGKFGPDVIVVSDCATYHFLSMSGIPEILLESSVPFVIVSQYNDENTSLSEGVYLKAKSVFRRADRVVFVSKRNLDVARRQMCESLPNALVLHNPPNVEVDRPVPFPSIAPSRFCMVARLDSLVKGHALLLQVMSNSKWLARDWVLDLFGAGKDEFYIRDLITFLGLQDRVRLRGHVADVAKLWEEQHVLLMPSSGEGKPLALTEALLCGRPAVVTDVGGNAELVQEGVSGFVAESTTIAAFDRALERMWDARSDWAAMGRRAHEFMRAQLAVAPGDRLAEIILKAGHGAK